MRKRCDLLAVQRARIRPRSGARVVLRARRWEELRHFLLSSRDLAPTTTTKTLGFLRILEANGVSIERPTRRAYDEFVAARKLLGEDGPGLRHYGRAMKHLLAWRRVVWPEFRLPRAVTNERALLPDEVVAQLLDYQAGRDELETVHAGAALRFAFYAALRLPSELYDLEVDDFDRRARTLRVWSDKTESFDVIDLEPWLSGMFAEFIDGPREDVRRGRQSRLFLDPYFGKPFSSPPALRMWLNRAARRVHEPFTGYDLRHAGLTWYYLATDGDLKLTQQRARHKSVRSTEYYVHVAERIKARRLAAANVQPYAPGALS